MLQSTLALTAISDVEVVLTGTSATSSVFDLLCKFTPQGIYRYHDISPSHGLVLTGPGKIAFERGTPPAWGGLSSRIHMAHMNTWFDSPDALKLYPSGDYGVGIWLTDLQGNWKACLMGISASGHAHLFHNRSPRFGFSLDGLGCLQVLDY